MRARRWLLASWMVGVVVGCSQTAPSPQAAVEPSDGLASSGGTPGADAGPLMPDDLANTPGLVVSEAPDAIAAARDAAQQLNDDLKQQRQDRITDFKQTISNSESPTSPAIVAAIQLCREHEIPAGMAYFERVLADGTPAQRQQVLQGLWNLQSVLTTTDFSPTMSERVLAQLDDDNAKVVAAAIPVCGQFRLPGAAAKLAKLSREENPPSPGLLFQQLAKLDPKPIHVERLGEMLMDESKRSEQGLGLMALLEFSASSDPRVVEKTREVLRRLVRNPEVLSGSPGMLDLATLSLVDIADSNDVPLLQSLFEQSPDAETKGASLAALARIEGEPGRQRILIALEDPELKIAAAKAIEQQLANTGDPQVVGWLQRAMNDETRDDVLAALAIALVRVGGNDAKKAAKVLSDRLTEPTRSKVDWIVAGNEPAAVIDRAVAAGLITRQEYERSLRAAKPAILVDDLEDVMIRANLGVDASPYLRSSSSQTPRDLLDMFVTTSGGKFKPEAVHEQITDQARTLSFIAGDKLYRLRFKASRGDEDVERMADAVNQALAAGGSPQRFVPTNDRPKRYLFADPRQLEQFASSLHAP